MTDRTFENLVVNNTLGIGTTEPAAQLHVAATEGISSKVFLESVNGSLLKVTAEPNHVSLGTENAFPLSINTNGLPRVQISSEGNVGIGTQPVDDTKLAVNGTVKAATFQGDGSRLAGKVNTAGDTMTGPLRIQSNLSVSGNVSIGTTSSSYKLAIAGGDINIDDGRALRQAGRWVIGGDSKILSIGSSDKSDGRDISFDPGFAGALTIKKDTGNIGIGTTQPRAKLEIVANSTTWGGWYEAIRLGQNAHSAITHPGGNLLFGLHSDRRFYFADMAEGQYIMTIDANPSGGGKVGIGTENPVTKLEVKGDLTLDKGESPILFTGTGNSELNRYLQLINSPALGSASGLKAGGILVSDSYAYANPSKNDLIVKGNVGIGTQSPNFGLDVRGNNAWIGSGDSSQSQGGWRLGRWPDYPSNDWVYLIRADSAGRYQDLAVGALWAGGALRFGTADDLAEMTPVKAEDNLEPGDVVVIENPPDNRVLLARSNKPYDSKVAGVISDPITAGLIIGGSHPTDVNRNDIKPLALAGRVLTKVTTENGSINAGDFLTTSSTPGHAMKATDSGHTLGKALQSFNGEQNGETKGKIWVLVNLGMS